MRIKIHPVRWWRDDDTRYMSRGEYRAPREVDPVAFIKAIDAPDRDAMLEWMQSFRREVNAKPIPWDAEADLFKDLTNAATAVARGGLRDDAAWLRVGKRVRDPALVPIVPLEFEQLKPAPRIDPYTAYKYNLPAGYVDPDRPLTVWRDRDPGDEQPADRWPYAFMMARCGGVLCLYPGSRAPEPPCELADQDPGDENDARTGLITVRPLSYTDGIGDGYDDYERIDKT